MKPSKRLQNSLILMCFITLAAIAIIRFPQSSPKLDQQPQVSSNKHYDSTDLATLCHNLQSDMKNVNAQRTTLALKQINQQIQICLPHLHASEQKRLMLLSDQMYQQFLSVSRDKQQQQAFEYYVTNQAQYPTIAQQSFEKLHSRDQYLIQHQSQAYIEVMNLGENQIFYRRNPLYLSKIFAPYLPEAEQQFINELAQQNLQPIWSSHHLTLSAAETARRALYWQEYLLKYRKSSYLDDAQYLSHYYTALLFEGSQDSPVSIKFDELEEIQADTLEQIQKLAQHDSGKLGRQARAFLRFVAMSPEQKQQNSKLVNTNANNSVSGKNSHTDVLRQLEHYLELQHPNPRNCFIDAICHPTFAQLDPSLVRIINNNLN